MLTTVGTHNVIHSRQAAEPTNKSRDKTIVKICVCVCVCLTLNYFCRPIHIKQNRHAHLKPLQKEQENAAPREIYLISHFEDALWWMCVPQRTRIFVPEFIWSIESDQSIAQLQTTICLWEWQSLCNELL
jgi:hypothetical protein